MCHAPPETIPAIDGNFGHNTAEGLSSVSDCGRLAASCATLGRSLPPVVAAFDRHELGGSSCVFKWMTLAALFGVAIWRSNDLLGRSRAIHRHVDRSLLHFAASIRFQRAM